MRTLSPATLPRRGLRGVAFIWFILLVMPMVFFSAALAIDFTRIMLAGREVTTAAQAASLAGAYQFVPGEPSLDAGAARDAAIETYCRAQTDGVLRMTQPDGAGIACPYGGSVSIDVDTNDEYGRTTEVVVSARYRVPNLLFVGFFGGDHTFVADPIVSISGVCVPGENSGPTNGHCVRPTG